MSLRRIRPASLKRQYMRKESRSNRHHCQPMANLMGIQRIGQGGNLKLLVGVLLSPH